MKIKQSIFIFLGGFFVVGLMGMGNTIEYREFDPSMTKKVMFGAGCFWGVEKILEKVPGVLATKVGYAGGATENPTYEEVCSGSTGHAEVVQVVYDPDKVAFIDLLSVFFQFHDPTQVNAQGPDIGSQYRSVIFATDDTQERLAKAAISRLNEANLFDKPIATEVSREINFFVAEDYHQKYLQKNPNGYCSHFLQNPNVKDILATIE